jgi:hypothetical protein
VHDKRPWLKWLRWPITALGLILAYVPLVFDFMQLRTLGFSPLGWVAVGTSLIVIMAAIWIYGLSRENDQLRQRLAPALEITFDPTDALCVHRCRRFISVANPIESTLCRVKVENLSSTVSIDEVKVRILQIDPNPPSLQATWPLREMNDVEGEASRAGLTLHPGEVRYIDVVAKEDDGRDFEFILASPPPTWVTLRRIDKAPARRYRLVLVAEGRNVPPRKASFTLDVAPESKVFLQPA